MYITRFIQTCQTILSFETKKRLVPKSQCSRFFGRFMDNISCFIFQNVQKKKHFKMKWARTQKLLSVGHLDSDQTFFGPMRPVTLHTFILMVKRKGEPQTLLSDGNQSVTFQTVATSLIAFPFPFI